VDPHRFDADPNATYHPDVDPDADLDTDLDSDFYLMRLWIQILFTLMQMRIRIQIIASK
jgi:hypothetical protein